MATAKTSETQLSHREELEPCKPSSKPKWLNYLIPCPCATAKSRTAATGDAIALKRLQAMEPVNASAVRIRPHPNPP